MLIADVVLRLFRRKNH